MYNQIVTWTAFAILAMFSVAGLTGGVAFLFPPRHPGSGARPSSIEVVDQKNIVLESQTFTS